MVNSNEFFHNFSQIKSNDFMLYIYGLLGTVYFYLDLRIISYTYSLSINIIDIQSRKKASTFC